MPNCALDMRNVGQDYHAQRFTEVFPTFRISNPLSLDAFDEAAVDVRSKKLRIQPS